MAHHYRQGNLISPISYLSQRFSPDFFTSIPRKPGVYFFKDDQGQVLYVGKAKNLRNRIRSYKQIRSDQGPKKIRLMLYRARKIEWEICPDETEALLKENHYLRSLKPQYNRMNTRPEFYFYLNLNRRRDQLFFSFDREVSEHAAEVFGAFKAKNLNRERLQAVLMLYLFADRAREFDMPTSLARGELRVAQNRYYEQLIQFLRGSSEALLQLAGDALEKETKLPGITRFRLTSALETCHDFYFGLLERNRLMLENLKTKRNYLLKEEVDDALVHHWMNR